MGGYGSGRRWGCASSARCTVEDSLVLGGQGVLAKTIRAANGSAWGGSFIWSRNGERFADIGYTLFGNILTLSYTRRETDKAKYPVTLVTTPQPKGGLRYWFKCPLQGCGRRTAKLYLPNGALYFGCRQCYNLTYESCNESHKFDAMFGHIAGRIGASIKEVKKALKEEWA
jgi:hypothetical protein